MKFSTVFGAPFLKRVKAMSPFVVLIVITPEIDASTVAGSSAGTGVFIGVVKAVES